MKSFFEVWRRHLWLWALPVGFCVLNLLGIALYRSAFAGKVERLDAQYQNKITYRDQLREERQVVLEFLEDFSHHKERANGLYSEQFQTEAQRFTRVIQDVKKLARQAGLQPTTLGYPRKDFGAHHLVQRNINFSVTGTYDQLRNFINFLELADHFVTLNSVTLGDSGNSRSNPTLAINLVLSTIFTTRDLAEAPEEPESPEEPEA